MLRICFAITMSFFSLAVCAQAQHVDGFSPYADTSYTTWSAFINTRKTNPEIRIVPELKSKAIAEKRNLKYMPTPKYIRAFDAFYPAGRSAQKRPAIMIIHGGGWRSGNPAQHYPLAQHLAARGYVCFTPNYALSTYRQYPEAIYDLKTALRWIVQHADKYHVDTSKIAVLGFSAGGELAAFLATTIGDPKFEANKYAQVTPRAAPIHALVDIDGTLSFTHPETGEGDDSKKISAATYWLGYAKKDSLALWNEASPLTHVGPHTPPTLFINSGVARMHAGREDFIKVLNQYNIYAEVKTFENAPHSFCLFDPWFQPTVNYIDDFLKRVFK